MTISHNYLVGAGARPTEEETTIHEIVINEADGLLYTKNGAGDIIRVGGQEVDLSEYALIVDVDADNAVQDAAISANTSAIATLDSRVTVNEDDIAANAAAIAINTSDIADNTAAIAANATAIDGKEDSVTYGSPAQMAIVNDTGDGFVFVEQPDFEFYRIRGAAIEYPYVEGDPEYVEDAFALTEGDNIVTELVAGVAPNVDSDGSGETDPSGVTYRTTEELVDIVIHPDEDPITIRAFDFIYWSGDNQRWLHIQSSVGDLDDYMHKNLSNHVTGTNTFTQPVVVAEPTAAAHASTRSYVDTGLNNLEVRITGNEGDIADNATDIADNAAKIEVNRSNIEDGGELTSVVTIYPGESFATVEYVDAGDAATLASAKAYTDTETAAVLVDAKLYTDTVTTGVEYGGVMVMSRNTRRGK